MKKLRKMKRYLMKIRTRMYGDVLYGWCATRN